MQYKFSDTNGSKFFRKIYKKVLKENLDSSEESTKIEKFTINQDYFISKGESSDKAKGLPFVIPKKIKKKKDPSNPSSKNKNQTKYDEDDDVLEAKPIGARLLALVFNTAQISTNIQNFILNTRPHSQTIDEFIYNQFPINSRGELQGIDIFKILDPLILEEKRA